MTEAFILRSCVCVLDTSCLLVQTHLLVNCSTIIWLPCIIYIHVIFYGSPQMLKVREFHCLICIIFCQMMIIWLPCIIYIHVIFYGSPQMLEVREFHCLICIIFVRWWYAIASNPSILQALSGRQGQLWNVCTGYIETTLTNICREWLEMNGYACSYCIYRHQMACCKDIQYLLLSIELSVYVLYLCKDIWLANTWMNQCLLIWLYCDEITVWAVHI